MQFITRDNHVVDRLETLAERITELKSEISNLSDENLRLKEQRDLHARTESSSKEEIENLKAQIERLEKDLKLATLSKPVSVTSAVNTNNGTSSIDENERKALKLQIEAMVEKINQHLEA